MLKIAIITACGFFKATVSMEQTFFIESPLVFVSLHTLAPSEHPRSFYTIGIEPFEGVAGALLLSLSVEAIILETSAVLQVLGVVIPLFALGLVVHKIPVVVRAVAEDVGALSVSLSVLEVADKEGVVLLVKLAKAVGHVLCLTIWYVIDLSLVDLAPVLPDDHILGLNFTEKF
jgi:hypothetical protein